MALRSTSPLGRLAAVSLDAPMAALAGLSVGFVAFAMPESVLSNAIRTSGLPTVVPAAEPPLGEAARLGLVGVAAVATFLFVWFLLRALGSKSPEAGRAEAPALELDAQQVPRLRRADALPDAPSRRPFFARDLGEPVEESAVVEAPVEPEAPPIPEPVAEAEPEPLAPEPIETIATSREAEGPSIASLMERLEQGLVRREQQKAARAAKPVEAVVEEENSVDARLRSALGDLQRLAARQS
ncbi:hypothetical protein [Allosphingosinicella humi]